MPGYSDDPEKFESFARRRNSLAMSLASSASKDPPTSVSGDPNIVILKQFEDTDRRVKDCRLSTSPTLTTKFKLEDDDEDTDLADAESSTSLMQTALAGGENFRYLEQFRNVVWKQLVQPELERESNLPIETSSVDIIERHASYFSPVCQVRVVKRSTDCHSSSTQ